MCKPLRGFRAKIQNEKMRQKVVIAAVNIHIRVAEMKVQKCVFLSLAPILLSRAFTLMPQKLIRD
jgi:hypothetical protein